MYYPITFISIDKEDNQNITSVKMKITTLYAKFNA